MNDKRLFSRNECFKHSAMASLGLASALLLAATGASEEKPRKDQRGAVMKIKNIERLWEKMLIGTYKAWGWAMSMVISSVEIAFWDIMGKSTGLLVCRLLGGVYRDKVRIYATLTRDKNPENTARRATAAVESDPNSVPVSAKRLIDACR